MVQARPTTGAHPGIPFFLSREYHPREWVVFPEKRGFGDRGFPFSLKNGSGVMELS